MIDAGSISELKAAALDEAKKVVGGNTALSRALQDAVSPQAISQWKQVPAERAIEVERVTGVSRDRLRPDIYPAPEKDAAA